MGMDSGLIFWTLAAASIILFVFGMRNKSWKALVWSGIIIFLPAIYFIGAENWFKLLGLVPLIPLGMAYFIVKNPVTE
jgi:hypothetical protein